MRTSDDTVRISDEAECVLSVSYPQIKSLSGLYMYNVIVFNAKWRNWWNKG